MSGANLGRLIVVVVLLAAVGLLIWLDLDGGGFRSWLAPQAILSMLTLIVGFIVLGWQLQRQHRNAIEANRRQAQDRLKLELYSKIAERIEATSIPFAELTVLPVAFVGELILRKNATSDRTTVPKSRHFEQLRQQQEAASRSVTALISALETHAIAMPEFGVFRERLAEALRAVDVAVNDFAHAAFPLAGSYSVAPMRWPPTEEESKVLSQLANSAQGASVLLTGVVWDLRVEAQNYLLGGLFPGRKVPPRVPGDSSIKVTTLPTQRPNE